MKKIETVAILGAGAVGSYFIYGLNEKFGEDLWIIAKGERKERLEKEGLMINHAQVALHVKTPEEARGVDLLLVAVKYGALEASLEDIAKVTDEHTIVMSLMNGVDSEEVIGNRIGIEHLVYSMMKIASERDGNSIVFNPLVTQGVYFGEADKAASEERIRAIADVFEGSKVNYHICEDIIQDIWFKYALNISKNLPQAMVNCGYGAYTESENVAALSSKLRDEVVAVAKAKGIDISDTNNGAGKNSAISPKARFSTLQDLDAKRHTEIDMFSGTLVRMGKELGIPTPYNEFTYFMIKALEEKNDGKLS
ncbi:MAG: ketopantoate reductase family protein [Lachnospiraceae bacterium]|nr:ketopantoate reductase family protein [Lachnospiraceae bacterium]